MLPALKCAASPSSSTCSSSATPRVCYLQAQPAGENVQPLLSFVLVVRLLLAIRGYHDVQRPQVGGPVPAGELGVEQTVGRAVSVRRQPV